MSIDDRRDEIIDRVRVNLHAAPGDVQVDSAVDAAIEHTLLRTELAQLPDNELFVNGLVGFSTRIYQDAFAPTGINSAIADDGFGPIFTPEKLDKHWREYFLMARVGWGVG